MRDLITQLRTWPSRPTFTSITLPKGHCPLGTFPSETSTTSPVRMSVLALCHFCRSAGKYSRIHLLQKTSERYCTCLHHRFAYKASFINTPCGILGFDFISNNMLDVSAGTSLGSLLSGVIGLSFIIFSVSVIKVCSYSSVSNCSLASAFRIVRAERIIRSHTPPIWLAHGGLKCHSISFCVICFSIVGLFHSWIDLRSSLSPLIRLVTLSLYTFSGTPRRLEKRWKAAIKESAVKLWATSRWTALVVRHVNKHPYLFKCVRPALTMSGLK